MKKPCLAIGISKDSMQPSITINQDILPIEQIIELARAYNVPVVFNTSLARQLSGLEVDEELPREFVIAVEEAIKFYSKQ